MLLFYYYFIIIIIIIIINIIINIVVFIRETTLSFKLHAFAKDKELIPFSQVLDPYIIHGNLRSYKNHATLFHIYLYMSVSSGQYWLKAVKEIPTPNVKRQQPLYTNKTNMGYQREPASHTD